MREARFLELGEIVEYQRVPRFIVHDFLLPAIFQVESPRFVRAVEEHEGVGAVRVEPNHVGSQGDGFVGGFQRFDEIAGQDKVVRYPADPADAELEIILPLLIVSVESRKAVVDGKALAVSLERVVELALRNQHVPHLFV